MAKTALPTALRTLAAVAFLVALVGGRAAAQRAAPTYSIDGTVELVQDGRAARDRSLDRTHSVIWYEPAGNARPPRPTTVEMLTIRKQFAPQVLVVPVGSTVRFPNRDAILHNVFSVSGKNSFDLGLVGQGEGKEAVFRESGIVRVFCNVHHSMFAHVVVVPTAYFAIADASGRFGLSGLPAGTGTLHYWHERGEVGSVRIRVPAAGDTKLAIEVTQPRIPKHRNKFGRSYSRGAYGG